MSVPLYRNRFRVPSARKVGWDYRWAGVYAVTICVRDRICCLASLVEGEFSLTALGEIVAEEWQRIPAVHPHVSLDDWVVMPDHLHGILIFERINVAASPVSTSRLLAHSLGAIVGQFKKRTKKRLWALRLSPFAWQERFYDQILLDARALEQYRAYIRDNPRRWVNPTKPVETP